MKYNIEINIKSPISKIISLLEDRKNDKIWQEGLVNFEHIEGSAGKEGAKSKITYAFGKREIEIRETIIKKGLNKSSFEYESNMVYNIVENSFISIDKNNTRWKQDHDFRGKSILLRIIIFLMPNVFKKQSIKFLNDFKKFTEINQYEESSI
tara:strand:+ start:279 stop:734 length:456 start_codon:yes stop_codon:yes gene_type:complete